MQWRHRDDVVIFALLAYALSWSWLLAVGVAGGVVEPGTGWPTHFPALVGPLLAAVAVTALSDGRSGLRDLARRMARWRVRPAWWLAALSPLLVLVLALVASALGGQHVNGGDLGVMSGLPTSIGPLGVVLILLVVNGFGEETGWRGFALDRLQERHGPLTATAIVLVLWACWHLPLFIVLSSFSDMSMGTTVGWVLGLACAALVATWLYNRTGRSILLVALWHGSFNVASATGIADSGNGIVAAAVTTVVMTQAVVLLILELVARRHGRSIIGPLPGVRTPQAAVGAEQAAGTAPPAAPPSPRPGRPPRSDRRPRASSRDGHTATRPPGRPGRMP